jgi:hypothetical protein
MTNTPFQDSLKRIHSSGKDWQDMSYLSDRARSHSWLKNMAENGAWGSAGSGRVGPPTPEEFPGLAKLLGTTTQQVAQMVVTDFYGIDATDGDYSARMRGLAPMIDSLDDKDAELVEQTVRRLGRS